MWMEPHQVLSLSLKLLDRLVGFQTAPFKALRSLTIPYESLLTLVIIWIPNRESEGRHKVQTGQVRTGVALESPGPVLIPGCGCILFPQKRRESGKAVGGLFTWRELGEKGPGVEAPEKGHLLWVCESVKGRMAPTEARPCPILSQNPLQCLW